MCPPLKKTSSDIWWIGKVVVPLHSQLKRTGSRKCLSLMSGEQVLLVSVTLGVPIYNITGVRRTSEVLEKNFSENLVVSKSCRTFALATPKKGCRKCPMHGWSLVTMIADRNACGVYMTTRLSSRSRDSMRRLLKRVSDRWKSIGEKNFSKKFGGFKNLSYLCTHNPQEKAVRSSHVKRS